MKKIILSLLCFFIFISISDALAQTIINEWEGHTGPANSVIFSKDGLQLITGGDDGTIRIFKVSDNSLQKVIKSKNNLVKKLALSDDGTKFAASGDKGYIEVYSYSTGSLLAVVTDTCRSFCFSSDGGRIYTCDDHLNIWELSSGSLLKSLIIPLSNVVVATKETSKVLIGGEDSKIYLFDFNGNQITREYAEHINPVLSLSLSPDGSRFASSSADRTIRIWDINNSVSLKMGFAHLGYVHSVRYSSDGTKVVTACEDGAVRLYSVNPIDVLHTFWGHTGGVYSAALSPNVEKIASVGKDGIMRLWNANSESYSLLESIPSHTGVVNNIEYSSDGYSFITSGYDNMINVWDPAFGFQIKSLSGHTDTITSLHFFKDVNSAISSSLDGSVKLWNLATGKSTMTINNQSPVRQVVSNQDGSKIFYSSDDGIIRVCDSKGKKIDSIKHGSVPVRALIYLSVGNIIAAGDDIGVVKIYNAADYSVKMSLKYSSAITKIAVSEDGTSLYSVISKRNLSATNISTGSSLFGKSFAENISDLKISKGRIAAVCEDGYLNLFNHSDPQKTSKYSFINVFPHSLVFSPDGLTLAIGGIGINNIKLLDPSYILSVEMNNFIPESFKVYQNYPNPFNPSTKINFVLFTRSSVKFDVYNILGEKVYTKIINNLNAGEHNISWNPSGLAGGVYFYTLNNGNKSLSGKMLYLK